MRKNFSIKQRIKEKIKIFKTEIIEEKSDGKNKQYCSCLLFSIFLMGN